MTSEGPGVHIVSAGLAMAPLLAELHGACFDRAWDVEAIKGMLSMPGTMAFVIGPTEDTPAGFVLANRAADQADILAIGILPGCRRQALGSALLTYLADDLRSRRVTQVFLEVAEDNEAAIRLYRACGFVKVGERKNYYTSDRTNRTALQMKYDLET